MTGTAISAANATIQVDGNTTLNLDGASIGGGTIKDFSPPVTTGSIIAGDIDIIGSSSISGAHLNNGRVTVASGKTLTLDNDTATGTAISAANATIHVDGNTTLNLDGASISGGTINDFSPGATTGSIIAGDIDITGSSSISGAHLNNGRVTVASGKTLTLDNDTVTGTAISAANATIQVDGNTTLNLDGVSITGGTINDFSLGATTGSIIAGDIDIIGSSSISGAHLNNGRVTVASGKTLTLDNDTVKGTAISGAGTTSIIQIDGNTTLKLDGATIDNVTVNDFSLSATGATIPGDIDVTGDSTISNAVLKGEVTVENGVKLTLDNVTVNDTVFTDTATGATLALDGHDALNGVTVNDGAVTVAASALVTTSGNVALSGTDVVNDGTIEALNGTLTIGGTLSGAGSVKIDGGVSTGALLELNATVATGQTIVFNGEHAELQIDQSSMGGKISGLAATDELDLRTIKYPGDSGLGTTATYDPNTGVLHVADANNVDSIDLTLVGANYTHAHFAGSSDGHGGTLITVNADDDTPVFAADKDTQAATVDEQSLVTGSSTTFDPTPAASGSIAFTDVDLTDRPTAQITAQGASWTGGALSQTQQDALQNALTLTPEANNNNGTIGWSYSIADGALDFLAAGETATVTSTITLYDHEGKTDTATVTVTITGTNDAPVITADTGGTNHTNVHDLTETDAPLTTTGTLAVSDADVTNTDSVAVSAIRLTRLAAGSGPDDDGSTGATRSTAATWATIDLHHRRTQLRLRRPTHGRRTSATYDP